MASGQWPDWASAFGLRASGTQAPVAFGTVFILTMRFLAPLRRRFWIVALALGCALPCFASELAVLRNGFSIRHERREVMGAVTRLYVGSDRSSYVDIPTLEIDHFEEAPPEERGSAVGFRASGTQTSGSGLRASGTLNVRPGARVVPDAVDLNQVVSEASGRYRLDPDLVNSVIKAESGFNVRAVSRKGAQGLMQLMPDTASKLGVPNAFDAQANVDGGTRYLRELLERYNFDLVKALAAYNAGPRRVEQYGGLPPYYETHAYVARIVRDFNKKKLAEQRANSVAAKTSAAKKVTTQPRKTKPAATRAGTALTSVPGSSEVIKSRH